MVEGSKGIGRKEERRIVIVVGCESGAKGIKEGRGGISGWM